MISILESLIYLPEMIHFHDRFHDNVVDKNTAFVFEESLCYWRGIRPTVSIRLLHHIKFARPRIGQNLPKYAAAAAVT